MRYRSIVVLTGAGVSAESGVRTFRDNDGLWEEHRVEDVATPEAFARNPDLVYAFYNARRAQLGTVEPNAAHRALARLEKEHRGDVLVVTQNVDDLHERAGQSNLIHMHGELKKARCGHCGAVSVWDEPLDATNRCGACGTVGQMRPHIVWFGEMPLAMDDIDIALAGADLFISVGTSGNVYPAAGFVQMVRGLGRAETVEINLEPSEGSFMFHDSRLGPAGRLVPQFVDELLS
ncbi:MAG: Sir2 family NAD+-dependent deacetylase [Pseudomonadota bacterium]